MNPSLKWAATYDDNTILVQQDNNSTEHINRSKLQSFALYDIGGNKVIELKFKPGQLLQYRCRTAMVTGHDITERVHIIVCQTGTNKYVVFVFESDMHIEISDFVDTNNATNDNQKLQYPIVVVESDLVPIGVV